MVVCLLTVPVAAETPDTSDWTPDQCQCDAKPAVVALCNITTFYPPDIPPADWETVGDQYYDIVSGGSCRTNTFNCTFKFIVWIIKHFPDILRNGN